MELVNDTVITLRDENDHEVEFDLLLVFDHDGKRYAAMMPLQPVEGIGENEIVILEVKHRGQDEYFDPIESPVLLDEVFREFEDLYEEKMDVEEDEDLSD